jgi:hypothetical protein
MYTTKDEQGLLNNFAAEPKMYYSEEPSGKQQRNYLIQGVLGLVLLAGVIATAFIAS